MSPSSGWIASVNAEEVGIAAMELGAGRQLKGQPVDPAVGIVLHGKVGDETRAGSLLFEIHANDERQAEVAEQRVIHAYGLAEHPVPEPPPILEIL